MLDIFVCLYSSLFTTDFCFVYWRQQIASAQVPSHLATATATATISAYGRAYTILRVRAEFEFVKSARLISAGRCLSVSIIYVAVTTYSILFCSSLSYLKKCLAVWFTSNLSYPYLVNSKIYWILHTMEKSRQQTHTVGDTHTWGWIIIKF